MANGSAKRIKHGWKLIEAVVHFSPTWQHALAKFRTGFDWADAAMANELIEAVAERCNARLPEASAWEFDFAVVGADATDAEYFAQLQHAVQISFRSYLRPDETDVRKSWGWHALQQEWTEQETWKVFCQSAGLVSGEAYGFRYATDVDGDGDPNTAYPSSSRLCQTGDLMQCPGGCGYLLDDLLDCLDLMVTVVLTSPDQMTYGQKFAWADDATMNFGDGEIEGDEADYNGDVDVNLDAAVANFVEQLSTHDGMPWGYAETSQTYRVGVGDGEGDTMDIVLLSTIAQGKLLADVGMAGDYVLFGKADLADGADTYKDFGANVPTDEMGQIGSGALSTGENEILIGRATMDTDEFEADNPFLQLRTKVEPRYTKIVVFGDDEYEWYVANTPEGRVERKGWFGHPGGTDEGYPNAEWDWVGNLLGNGAFSAGPAFFGPGDYSSDVSGTWNSAVAAGSASLKVIDGYNDDPCEIPENEDCEDPEQDFICTAEVPDNRCPDSVDEDDPCENPATDEWGCDEDQCEDEPNDLNCRVLEDEACATVLCDIYDNESCAELQCDQYTDETCALPSCDIYESEIDPCTDVDCDEYNAEPDPCPSPECEEDPCEADLCDGVLCDGVLCDGDLCDGDLCDGDLCDGDLCDDDPSEDCGDPDCEDYMIDG